MSAGYFIPDKQYFNIGEASRVTQVPSHTLRYWETTLNQPRPIRRSSGHRRYTRKDIEAVFKIKELLYDRKLTLAGAKRELGREGRVKAPDAQALSKLKRELRQLLLDLQK